MAYLALSLSRESLSREREGEGERYVGRSTNKRSACETALYAVPYDRYSRSSVYKEPEPRLGSLTCMQ